MLLSAVNAKTKMSPAILNSWSFGQRHFLRLGRDDGFTFVSSAVSAVSAFKVSACGVRVWSVGLSCPLGYCSDVPTVCELLVRDLCRDAATTHVRCRGREVLGDDASKAEQ